MKKLLYAAAVVAALSPSTASAYYGHSHGWQGFAMDHRFWWGDPGSVPVATFNSSTPEEIAKAKAQQKLCEPVVMWTDAGKIVHPAMGCTP